MIAAHFALVSAGLFLFVGMITGWWKYRHMMQSPDALAPAYVDICHRTALMYSFACIVLQQLALQSRWPDAVNISAVVVPILFFASAVAGYAMHGWLRDTDNQLRRPHKVGNKTVPSVVIRVYMFALAIGQIGGLTVLLAGAV